MPVAVGDLHLDANANTIPHAVQLVLATLAKVADYARREGERDLILLGDIFDNAGPSQRTVTQLVDFLVEHRDLRWHIIMGNHDHDSVETHSLEWVRSLYRHRFLRGRVYLKPRVVKLSDGESYFFCPHPYITDQPKDTRYAFGHFGYAGARGDNGFVLKTGNKPRGRWILGDYHTAQRGKNYLYPGSLCQVNHHEQGSKHFAHITDKVRLIEVRPELRLGRTSIRSQQELDALDPKVFWSVNIARGVELPPDWAQRYPHVVKHHVERTANKRQQVLMKQVASADPLEGLDEYLRNDGLDDAQIARAYTLLGRKQAA